jgi:hypothetical protein
LAPRYSASSRIDAGMQGADIQALSTLVDDVTATVLAIDQAVQALKDGAPQSWTYHYASVVARDGGDSVTLENYNRTSEDRSVLEREVRGLLAHRNDLDTVIEHVHAWMGNHEVIINPEITAEERRTFETHRDEAAAQLRQLGLAFESDAQPEGDRWFFQMYGPVKSVPGAADDQSFHRAWTQTPGEFSNPLTLRVSGVADAGYKQRMVAEMRTRVDAAVGMWEPTKRRAFKAQIEADIDEATTRVEVARAIERGVARARAEASTLLGSALEGLLSPITLDFPDLTF